jgi:hypothetical protein
MRMFKIVKKYKSLRILFFTFVQAIPQLTNVGGLLILALILFSVLGVEWFATVKLQEDLTIHANFRSFGAALLTLFRMATGESWQAIMFDCARPRSILFDCHPDPQFEDFFDENGELDTPGCGNKFQATLFFTVFMFVVSFIFLNLFIAIILESFESSMDDERLQVGESTINKFQDYWCGDKFDPKGTKFIKIANFADFLRLLIDEEIRMKILYDEKLMNNEISEEELLSKEVQIFLFNIHQQLVQAFPSIYKEVHRRLHKEMIENQEIAVATEPDDKKPAASETHEDMVNQGS